MGKKNFLSAFPHSESQTPVGCPVDRAVVDLHIARRTLLIYPADHDQVKNSLNKSYQSLSAVLEKSGSLTLTVLKSGIAANRQTLNSNPTVFADLSAAMKEYQIAAVTFSPGLTHGQFHQFLSLMTTGRETIAAKGGIGTVIDTYALSHVQVRPIDYSRLQVTEEREIQCADRRENGGALWKAFVTQVLSKKTGQDRPPADPAALADMLNRQILDAGEALDQYGSVVSDAVHAPSEGAGVAEKFSYFNELIRELNPELQNQFLATTFDRCAHTNAASDSADPMDGVADGLGADLLMRMLQQAGTAGKRISPSLLAFVNKVAAIETSAPVCDTGGGDITAEGFSWEQAESLMAHEQYETYVDSDYATLLSGFCREGRIAPADSKILAFSRQIKNGLDDKQINSHVGSAMMRLMTVGDDKGAYRNWARQLAYLLDDLLEDGAFDLLNKVLDFSRREKRSHHQHRVRIADLLLNRFNETRFVSRVFWTLRDSPADFPAGALEFVAALGEPLALEIIDSLDPDQTFKEDSALTRMMRQLSTHIVREALERIKDPRPDYVRCMLRIIRKMGDRESAQHVRSVLDHDDFNVRMAALATLLKFKNNWGVIRVKEILDQSDSDGFHTALELAGKYRVNDALPQLVSMVQQRKDPQRREAVLRVLGRIGDPAAIPALTKLAQSRWAFASKQSRFLNRVLYETLGTYPLKAVKPLLHHGLKQRDGAIQSICRTFLKKGAGAVIPRDAAQSSLNPGPETG